MREQRRRIVALFLVTVMLFTNAVPGFGHEATEAVVADLAPFSHEENLEPAGASIAPFSADNLRPASYTLVNLNTIEGNVPTGVEFTANTRDAAFPSVVTITGAGPFVITQDVAGAINNVRIVVENSARIYLDGVRINLAGTRGNRATNPAAATGGNVTGIAHLPGGAGAVGADGGTPTLVSTGTGAGNSGQRGRAIAFDIGSNANVSMILLGEYYGLGQPGGTRGYNLFNSNAGRAGIHVPPSATLNIFGPGSLTAIGGGGIHEDGTQANNGGGAGIGTHGATETANHPYSPFRSGTINIHGGHITAIGGNGNTLNGGGGAGIGGGGGNGGAGFGAQSAGDAGDIVILGGTVRAYGGHGAGGIGSWTSSLQTASLSNHGVFQGGGAGGAGIGGGGAGGMAAGGHGGNAGTIRIAGTSDVVGTGGSGAYWASPIVPASGGSWGAPNTARRGLRPAFQGTGSLLPAHPNWTPAIGPYACTCTGGLPEGQRQHERLVTHTWDGTVHVSDGLPHARGPHARGAGCLVPNPARGGGAGIGGGGGSAFAGAGGNTGTQDPNRPSLNFIVETEHPGNVVGVGGGPEVATGAKFGGGASAAGGDGGFSARPIIDTHPVGPANPVAVHPTETVELTVAARLPFIGTVQGEPAFRWYTRIFDETQDDDDYGWEFVTTVPEILVSGETTPRLILSRENTFDREFRVRVENRHIEFEDYGYIYSGGIHDTFNTQTLETGHEYIDFARVQVFTPHNVTIYRVNAYADTHIDVDNNDNPVAFDVLSAILGQRVSVLHGMTVPHGFLWDEWRVHQPSGVVLNNPWSMQSAYFDMLNEPLILHARFMPIPVGFAGMNRYLPPAHLGMAYSHTIPGPSGGSGSFVFSNKDELTGHFLPGWANSGLNLLPDGTIQGTPTFVDTGTGRPLAITITDAVTGLTTPAPIDFFLRSYAVISGSVAIDGIPMYPQVLTAIYSGVMPPEAHRDLEFEWIHGTTPASLRATSAADGHLHAVPNLPRGTRIAVRVFGGGQFGGVIYSFVMMAGHNPLAGDISVTGDPALGGTLGIDTTSVHVLGLDGLPLVGVEPYYTVEWRLADGTVILTARNFTIPANPEEIVSGDITAGDLLGTTITAVIIGNYRETVGDVLGIYHTGELSADRLIPAIVPGAPVLAAPVAGDGTTPPGYSAVALSWTAPTFTGGAPITGYRVYYSTTGSGGPWVPRAAVSAVVNSYIASGLASSTEHWFRVVAVNSADTLGGDEAVAGPVTPVGQRFTATLNIQLAGAAWDGHSDNFYLYTPDRGRVPLSRGGSTLTANVYSGEWFVYDGNERTPLSFNLPTVHTLTLNHFNTVISPGPGFELTGTSPPPAWTGQRVNLPLAAFATPDPDRVFARWHLVGGVLGYPGVIANANDAGSAHFIMGTTVVTVAPVFGAVGGVAASGIYRVPFPGNTGIEPFLPGTLSIATLPPGISIDPAGYITGYATQAGGPEAPWTFTVTRDESGQNVIWTYTIIINRAPSPFPTDPLNVVWSANLRLNQIELVGLTNRLVWENPLTLVGDVGSRSFLASFTYSDNHTTVTGMMPVSVTPAPAPPFPDIAPISFPWVEDMTIEHVQGFLHAELLLRGFRFAFRYFALCRTTHDDFDAPVNAGENQPFRVIYTRDNHLPAPGTVLITINPIAGSFVQPPRQTIQWRTDPPLTRADVPLPAGFEFAAPTTPIPGAGIHSFPATFSNPPNFLPADGNIEVEVTAADGIFPDISPHSFYWASGLTVGGVFDLLLDELRGEGFDPDRFTLCDVAHDDLNEPIDAGQNQPFTVIYNNPPNYKPATQSVDITINPAVSTFPDITIDPLTWVPGMTLANVHLPIVTGGALTWRAPHHSGTTIANETAALPFNVTFTPDDTNFAPADGTVTVSITRLEFTVTFDFNGGYIDDDTYAKVTVPHGENVPGDQIPSPRRAGWNFDAWYPADYYRNVTTHRTIYAQWDRIPPADGTFPNIPPPALEFTWEESMDFARVQELLRTELARRNFANPERFTLCTETHAPAANVNAAAAPQPFTVIYTNAPNYNPVGEDVNITINPAPSTFPTIGTIGPLTWTSGMALDAVSLPSVTGGVLTWRAPHHAGTTIANATAESSFNVTFTPDDTNFAPADGTVTVSITRLEFTVTFDFNGGYIGDDTYAKVTVPHGENVPGDQIPSPTRYGWNFDAWNPANGHINVTENTTIYAQWSRIYHEVRFEHGDGGTGGPVVRSVPHGSPALPEPAFTHAGDYAFAGWSADPPNITVGNITAPVTFTATWAQRLHEITFHPNYGTGDFPARRVPIGDFSIPPLEGRFTRDYHIFVGWNTRADGGGTHFGDAGTITVDGSITLFAQWAREMTTISFDAGYGYGTMTPQAVLRGAAFSVPAHDFEKPNHNFAHWLDCSGNIRRTGEEFYAAQPEITLTAQWTIVTHTVTLVAVLGDAPPVTVAKDHGATFTVPQNPFIVPGSNFRHWNTVPDGSGTRFMPEDEITVTENITLFAQWDAVIHAVIFEPGGGEGTMQSASVAAGDDFEVPHNAFTREGFTFTHWSDGENDFDPGDIIVNVIASRTFVAQWEINTHTVTFNLGGGNVAGEVDDIVVPGVEHGTDAAAPAPQRDGYIFGGWFPVGGYANVTSDITVTALWTRETRTVTLMANGGMGADGTAITHTVPLGDEFEFPANEFVRTGYTFLHWNTRADNIGINRQVGDIITVDRNLTFFAAWTRSSYTVSFNANLGDGTMEPITVRHGASFAVPANAFTFAGHVFTGWNTEPDGTGDDFAEGETVENITASMTLFAQWEGVTIIHAVAFDPAGGAGTMSSIPVVSGGSITVPPNAFEFFGRTFSGWYSNGEYFDPGDTIDDIGASRTLYARWTLVSHSVTFMLDGGNVGGDERDFVVPVFHGENATPPAPERDGHILAGWLTAGAYNNVTGNVTVIAQWQPEWLPHTITFHANIAGAQESIYVLVDHSANVVIDIDITRLATPGYHTFTGWNTRADGTGRAFAKNVVLMNVTGDMNLFAQWQINTYTVTFHGNGADSGDMDAGVVNHGDSFALPPLGFTRADFHFVSWNTEPDGIGISFEAGGTIPRVTSNMALFAQWQPGPADYHLVTFVLDGGNIAGETTDVVHPVAGGGNATLPPPPTKYAYRFAGWYPANGHLLVNAPVTITALWEPISFAINILHGGDGATVVIGDRTYRIGHLGFIGMAAPSAVRGERVEIFAGESPYGALGRHVFDGWQTTTPGGVTLDYPYRATATFDMIAGDVQITATWRVVTKDAHRVEILNPGPATSATPEFAYYGDTVTLVAGDRPDYVFAYWRALSPAALFASPAALFVTAPAMEFVMPDGNVIIEAVWRPAITVTFSANLGDNGDFSYTRVVGAGQELGALPVIYRYDYDFLADPPRRARFYVFAGWYENPLDRRTRREATDTVHDNLHLFARWEFDSSVMPPDFRVGDVNRSGSVTTLDATVLARFLANQLTENDICVFGADVNGDGEICTADLVLLSRWLVGHNVHDQIAPLHRR